MPDEPGRHHAVALSRRESLLFEAGIKLGGIFHQYLGVPVHPRTAPGLGRTIASAVRLQPYVRRATVRIDPHRGGALGRGRFAYAYLTAEMLDVRLTLSDGPEEVDVRLSFREDLRYPLMRVEGMRGPRDPPRGERGGRTPGRRRRRTARSAG